MKFARFRADPKLVRVAVRPTGLGGFWAEVTARDGAGQDVYTARAMRASQAVIIAVTRANMGGLPGIDLDMMWAYEHPFPGEPE